MRKKTVKTRKPLGRLKKKAAPEVINTACELEIGDAEILFAGMSLADIAHVIALLEAKLVPRQQGASLLRELLKMHHRPLAEYSFRPECGDTYKNRERCLAAVIPNEVGWLHAGRARREASTIAWKIAVRTELLTLGELLAACSAALLRVSAAHPETYMPDYTYLQHAQPTVLGHYLFSFIYPLIRDCERVKINYTMINKSPAGSGSVNGTRLKIDRRRLASLLGFDGLVSHTRDAMWQADIPIDIMATIVTILTNLDRFAEELMIWSTHEFSMVELADEHCRQSVIMPQKKNPYSLAYIRGLARQMLGKISSIAALGQTPSGQVDNRIFIYGEIPRALTQTNRAVRLITAVITNLKFNRRRMKELAGHGFLAATDLADQLLISEKIDYHAAHRLLGTLIRSTQSQRRDKISYRALQREYQQQFGKKLKLTSRVFAKVTKLERIIESRKTLGGAAKAALTEMHKECSQQAAAVSKWARSEAGELRRAQEVLLRTAVGLGKEQKNRRVPPA